jgi:hypothetical protein
LSLFSDDFVEFWNTIQQLKTEDGTQAYSYNLDQDILEVTLEEGTDQEARPQSVPSPPPAPRPMKTPKREANKVVAEMQQINTAIKTIVENVHKRKTYIKDNKRRKIMTIYSKEVKRTRRRVEDAMKENREECMLMRGDFNRRIGERGARN